MTPKETIFNDGNFLQEPRFELIPMKGVEDQAKFLPDEATVAVTVSPSKGLDATLKLNTWKSWSTAMRKTGSRTCL